MTCCLIRRKVVVGVVAVLTEEACGVGDAELADVLSFDHDAPSGKPVLAFKYCPWCGASYGPSSEVRVTDIDPDDEDDEGEEWKNA